jgi:hypothetical protein
LSFDSRLHDARDSGRVAAANREDGRLRGRSIDNFKEIAKYL